jgi:predicted NBD/HSP70 family sugar kinase
MLILAADVGGTTIKLGLVSDGDLLATHSLPAKADLSMINRLEAMARSWESLLTDLNLTTKDLDGVGLALPFLIDPAGTSVAGDFDKFHGADTIDFPKWTRERFGLPLILENDLRLALMGEWRQGVAQNQTDVVMLGLGTGIGCAALCGGRLLRGARNRAGAMLGHMTVALDMPRGRCGNFGCAEDLASTATLRDRAQEQPGFENSRLKADDALDFESLFEAVDAGDPCAQGMLEDCLKVWSTVALNIALAYDPAMVDTTEITRELADGLSPDRIVQSEDSALHTNAINRLVEPCLGNGDPVFGCLSSLCLPEFFDPDKVRHTRSIIETQETGLVLVIGCGARLIHPGDVLVYADPARWEAQLRFRRGDTGNLWAQNQDAPASLKYKRAYFADWRVADRWKKPMIPQWDFLLDTHQSERPKLVAGEAVRRGLAHAVTRPFRVVPFFDPAPRGGQWLRAVCDLDRAPANYGWGFD